MLCFVQTRQGESRIQMLTEYAAMPAAVLCLLLYAYQIAALTAALLGSLLEVSGSQVA